MSKIKYLFCLTTMGAFLFIGCGESAKSGASSPSSTSPDGSAAPVEEQSMWVQLFDNGLYPYYMSIAGSFGSKCEIASGQTGQSIDCMIDVNELDIYFNGATIQSNFPTNMCDYVSFIPYWYYNHEIGYGPSTVSLNITKDADGLITGYTCNIDSVVGCSATEATYAGEGEEVNCIYDRTKSEGPNCCLGTYSKTVTTTSPSGTTVVSTTAKWGGDVKSCTGGPGSLDWKLFTKAGYPAGEISATKGKGLNSKYDITAPIKAGKYGYTLPIANYYKPYSASATANHRHTGYTLTRSSDLPYMVDPVDDRNGTSVFSGSPAYTWQCLDKNHEVINQIKVYVREWNTQTEFLKYGTSAGVQGDPDIIGNEGTSCDFQNSGSNCEDYIDQDYYKGPYTVGNRRSYFPQVD